MATGLVNSLLAFGEQRSLDVYFTVNIIVYLLITLLYVYLNPRARRALDTIGYMLFAGFLVIIAIKVLHMISGS